MTVLSQMGFQNFQLGIFDMIAEYNIPFDIREVLECKAAIINYIIIEEEEEVNNASLIEDSNIDNRNC
jgi:hypothetical protein